MKYKSGFTLWELVIVVAIIGLLANLTIPAFSALTQQRRSDVIAVQLEEMVRYARAEALRRNVNIMLCGASSSDINHTKESDIQIATCLSNTNLWSSGIVAIVDNGTGTGQKLKAMSIESASFSSAVIVPYFANAKNKSTTPGDGLYTIDKDSTLQPYNYSKGQNDPNAQYPCFDIKQKINGQWNHVIVAYSNRYGNEVKCRKSTGTTENISICGCT